MPLKITKSRQRRRFALVGVGLVATLVLAACGSGADQAVVTETQVVTVAPSGPETSAPSTTAATTAPPSTEGSSSAPPSSTPGSSTPASSSTPATSSSTAPTTGTDGGNPYENPQDGVALPDGFVPRKLKEGEHPPQFVVVSFDGVGWDEKWKYWLDIGKQVPFRFTGFLSGTYLLSDETKDAYTGPGHQPGDSDINWNTAADLPVEIENLNAALAAGNEIGTHFNGHFCEGSGASFGNVWTTADWNEELDQFFSLLKNYQTNNDLPDGTPPLQLKASEILGERTPCLEGTQGALFPALTEHHMIYDSSFTKRGITWPKQSPQYKIWQMGMAEFPIHGTLPDASPVDPDKRTNRVQITMDYNFWYSQRNGGVGTPEESAADSQQVLDTYRDMYDAAFNGNRAPLILGNHFNDWNNSAYSDAIANFVKETCGKADTECVPFQDVIAWMLVQDPDRLAGLQAQNPELGVATG